MLQWERRNPSIAESSSRLLSLLGATGSTRGILHPCLPQETASGTATEPAASPWRAEGKGLAVAGRRAGLEGSKVSTAMVTEG